MYKRVIRIEARDSLNGEPFFITEDLRVTFEIDIGIAQGQHNIIEVICLAMIYLGF